MQRLAGVTAVAAERPGQDAQAYNRWRAAVLANRDLVAGLLPTLMLYACTYGLVGLCYPDHSLDGFPVSLHGLNRSAVAEYCASGAAATEGPSAKAHVCSMMGGDNAAGSSWYGSFITHLCRQAMESKPDGAGSSSIGSWLAGWWDAGWRFMVIQVCNPIMWEHYESLWTLASLYGSVLLALFWKRQYISWRPVLLINVRVFPQLAGAVVAYQDVPRLLRRLSACFMFFGTRPGRSHQLAAQLLGVDPWQLQQMLLSLAVCWQAVALPLPPRVEAPVAATQMLLLVLTVGRISQAFSSFHPGACLLYWLLCLVCCYIIPTWYAGQLDCRLRARFRALHSAASQPAESEESGSSSRGTSCSSDTSWHTSSSKEDTYPWPLPGEQLQQKEEGGLLQGPRRQQPRTPTPPTSSSQPVASSSTAAGPTAMSSVAGGQAPNTLPTTAAAAAAFTGIPCSSSSSSRAAACAGPSGQQTQAQVAGSSTRTAGGGAPLPQATPLEPVAAAGTGAAVLGPPIMAGPAVTWVAGAAVDASPPPSPAGGVASEAAPSPASSPLVLPVQPTAAAGVAPSPAVSPLVLPLQPAAAAAAGAAAARPVVVSRPSSLDSAHDWNMSSQAPPSPGSEGVGSQALPSPGSEEVALGDAAGGLDAAQVWGHAAHAAAAAAAPAAVLRADADAAAAAAAAMGLPATVLPAFPQPVPPAAACVAPSITTVYMQLPVPTRTATGAAAGAASPFWGTPPTSLAAAALELPTYLARMDDVSAPPTPSGGPGALRSASKTSQGSAGWGGGVASVSSGPSVTSVTSTSIGSSSAVPSAGSFSGSSTGGGGSRVGGVVGWAASQLLQAAPEAAGAAAGAAGTAAATGTASQVQAAGRQRSALYTSRTQHMLLSAKVRFDEAGDTSSSLPTPASSSTTSATTGGALYPAHAQQVAAAAIAAVQDIYGGGTPIAGLPDASFPGQTAHSMRGGGGGASSSTADAIGHNISNSSSSSDLLQTYTPPRLASTPTAAVFGSVAGGLGWGRPAAAEPPVLLRVECVTFPGCVELLLWGWCAHGELQQQQGEGGTVPLNSGVAENRAAAGNKWDVELSREVQAAAAQHTAQQVEAAAAAALAGCWDRVKEELLQVPGVVAVEGACLGPCCWVQEQQGWPQEEEQECVAPDQKLHISRGAACVGAAGVGSKAAAAPVVVAKADAGVAADATPDAGLGKVLAAGGSLAAAHKQAPAASAAAAAGGVVEAAGSHSSSSSSSAASTTGHFGSDAGGVGGAGGDASRSGLGDTPGSSWGSGSGGEDTPSRAPCGLALPPEQQEGLGPRWLFHLERHSPLVLLAHPDLQTVQLHLVLRWVADAPSSNPYLTALGAAPDGSASWAAGTGSVAGAGVGVGARHRVVPGALPRVEQLLGQVGNLFVLLVRDGQVASTWVWPEEQLLVALRHQLGDAGDDEGEDDVAAARGGSDQRLSRRRTAAATAEGYQFILELQLPLLVEPAVCHLVLAHELPALAAGTSPAAGAVAAASALAAHQASVAFARVPLALLPLVPYQEVHQTLLPAMWDEAAADWQRQRQARLQQQLMGGPGSAGPSSSGGAAGLQAAARGGGREQGPSLEEHVQGVLWQHWCQLADDLGQLIQLAGSLLPHWQQQQLSDAELHLLQQLAPVVLSFFLGHGMDACFFYVLSLLPPPLQQSWVQVHQQRTHVQLMQQHLQFQQQQEQQQQLLAAAAGSPSAAPAAAAGASTSEGGSGVVSSSGPMLNLPLLGAASSPGLGFYDDSSMALSHVSMPVVAACTARSSLEMGSTAPISVACPERLDPMMSAPAQLQGAAERVLSSQRERPEPVVERPASEIHLGSSRYLPRIGGSFRTHSAPGKVVGDGGPRPSITGVTTPAVAGPRRLVLQHSLASSEGSRPSSSRWDAMASVAAAAGAAGLGSAESGEPWMDVGSDLSADEEVEVEEEEVGDAKCKPAVAAPRLTWSTPFTGFDAAAAERRYKLHKHASNLSADWGCAGFILLFMSALTLRLVWEADRWNTSGYILYLGLKLVAYVPLLAGRTEFFISHRELLVVVLSQGLCCLLIANKALAEYVLHLPPLFTPPEGPLRAFWKVHAELLIYGLMMPFQVHLRMSWNTVYVLTEAATLAYLFGHVFPLWQVVVRFSGAAVLSLTLAWWWDLLLRRRFLAAEHQGGDAAAGDSCSKKLLAIAGESFTTCSSGGSFSYGGSSSKAPGVGESSSSCKVHIE